MFKEGITINTFLKDYYQGHRNILKLQFDHKFYNSFIRHHYKLSNLDDNLYIQKVKLKKFQLGKFIDKLLLYHYQYHKNTYYFLQSLNMLNILLLNQNSKLDMLYHIIYIKMLYYLIQFFMDILSRKFLQSYLAVYISIIYLLQFCRILYNHQ